MRIWEFESGVAGHFVPADAMSDAERAAQVQLTSIVQQLVGAVAVDNLRVRAVAYEQIDLLARRRGFAHVQHLLHRYRASIYPFVLRNVGPDDAALVHQVAGIFDMEGREFVQRSLPDALLEETDE